MTPPVDPGDPHRWEADVWREHGVESPNIRLFARWECHGCGCVVEVSSATSLFDAVQARIGLAGVLERAEEAMRRQARKADVLASCSKNRQFMAVREILRA